ncbi:MAG: hypothetical protein GF317_21320 [Candidatus Lokiarchaeota archaeon]|nr:hypothetical protein [Candidatus Lokiarchaeota archaeon]MBD3201997.1 hypothetical protein [Candidatus Lokiarchaeota archaeon]
MISYHLAFDDPHSYLILANLISEDRKIFGFSFLIVILNSVGVHIIEVGFIHLAP